MFRFCRPLQRRRRCVWQESPLASPRKLRKLFGLRLSLPTAETGSCVHWLCSSADEVTASRDLAADGEVMVAGEELPVNSRHISASVLRRLSHGFLPCRSLMCPSDTAPAFNKGEVTDP